MPAVCRFASLLFALVPCTAAQAQSAGDLLTQPQRVTGASWREVASAQVGQGAFAPMEGEGPDVGWLELVIAGRPVELVLDQDGLWVDVDADGGAAVVPLDFEQDPFPHVSLEEHGVAAELMIYRRGEERRVTVMTHYHFEAELSVDGAPVRLVFLDMDLDGAVSAGDQWLALDERQSAFAELPALLFASLEMDEGWYFGERLLVPSGYGDDGELELSLRPWTQPRHAFLAERAARKLAEVAEHFDETRESFFETYDLERGRPVDPNPPGWFHARDLPEALAHARAVQRPLYVEFGSGGCPWCKRYDWLNYRDAAVTERLRRFALVKIDRDLDPLQTARGLGLDGVPCHALFDPAGDGTQAVHTSRGWIGPEHYVGVLDEALEAWEAGGGGQ